MVSPPRRLVNARVHLCRGEARESDRRGETGPQAPQAVFDLSIRPSAIAEDEPRPHGRAHAFVLALAAPGFHLAEDNGVTGSRPSSERRRGASALPGA
jgi:hypothetical protein